MGEFFRILAFEQPGVPLGIRQHGILDDLLEYLGIIALPNAPYCFANPNLIFTGHPSAPNT